MATQFSILAKVKVDTADIQKQLDNVKGINLKPEIDTEDFELSISVANAVMREFVQIAEEMIEEVYTLDKSLTEFKKVSDLRGSNLEQYVDQLTEAGQSVARTTSDMVDAATMFRKSGFTDAEASELATIASMYQNIADTQVSGAQAAASIVSQLQAFGREALEPIHIIDAYNEVANNFAVGTNDLSRALELSAAGMATYGNSFEQVIGLVTAGSEIMQGRSAQVARGLNTISANIVENSDTLADYGITVKGLDGSLKSTYDVLAELKPLWDSLADAERQELGVALAGKNQYRVLASIMANFEHAIQATETAIESSNSAIEENTAYMESLESKTTMLKATFQTLANDVIPKELIANGLEVLNKFLQILDSDLGIILTRITLLTGIGWGLSALVSASKILPTIIGQFSNLVTLFTNGASAIGGVVGILGTFSSVALPVIAVLTTLGIGIYEVYKQSTVYERKLEELIAPLENWNDLQVDVVNNLNKTISETEATVITVNKYLDRLDELDTKTEKTNEEQLEYHAILEQIVNIAPSVASGIDLQTNSIKNGTNAIRNQIEAWKELAIQQAYQSQMSSLYQAKAELELERAKKQVELTGREVEKAYLLEQDKVYSQQLIEGSPWGIFGDIYTQSQYQKNVLNPLQEIRALEDSIAKYDEAILNAQNDIEVTESALAELLKGSGVSVPTTSTAYSNKLKQMLGSYTFENDPFAAYRAGWAETAQEVSDIISGDSGGGGSISSAIAEATFNLSDYTSTHEKLISLLNSEYSLLQYQNATDEELVDKAKQIQWVLHDEAEVLRNILKNADALGLDEGQIYDIQSNINSLSIDWWSWEQKINDILENQKDTYQEIADELEVIFEKEKERLSVQKDALSALSSEMTDYYQTQIDAIDEQISALKEANSEIEEQIALEEKLDNLAKAKQTKVLVYKDGRFQYVQDADAVSAASKELADLERQQQLNKDIEGLEAEKAMLESLKSAWGDMEQSYESEQNKWLISQELGINTALEGWQRLVNGASYYAEMYKNIMNSMSFIQNNGDDLLANLRKAGTLGDGNLPYDPTVDYSALIMQSTSAMEAKNWAELREAKIKGENMQVEKSTAEFLRDWHEKFYGESNASGTLSSRGGLSLVGEQGAELRVLNRGDGIIPHKLTENLMSWGRFSPNEYQLGSLFNNGQSMNVTIQALNLPNVTNGNDFVEYIRNTMFGQVLSYVY